MASNPTEPAPATQPAVTEDSPPPQPPPAPAPSAIPNGTPAAAEAVLNAATLPNGSIPDTNVSSTAAKLSIMSKLLTRKNKVHDATYAERTNAQQEFMQKFSGPNQAPVEDNPDAQPSEPEGFYQRWKKKYSTYVIDPSEDSYYYWTLTVSVAYAYNLVVVIARQAFPDMIGPRGTYRCFLKNGLNDNATRPCRESDDYLRNMNRMPFLEHDLSAGWREYWYVRLIWICLDLMADSVYLMDMWIRGRTGYLEQGLVVKDTDQIWKRYKVCFQYKLDLFSMIPLDYFVGWPVPFSPIPSLPILRLNRLIRINRVSDWRERTETRSSIPNAFRVVCVVIYIIVIIHWNACLYFGISEWIGLGSDGWVYGNLNKQSLPDDVMDTLMRRYIYSFYWSTLILTTIGEVPGPVLNLEFLFVTADLMCGVLIFATIVGNVGSMISNMSAARTEFQNKMDGIKQYMELRKVSKQLEARVIKWFDYLWANKQSLSDQQVLKVLPDKLQAEIAMQVHFETLRKVRIFQDCEAGLLAELVLKLKLQVFSPGDYICRKGDIGREMYIVKRGKLQVVSDDPVKVFAILQEGSVFGELSILNIAGSKNGNRRTANVRSVGYTDLFVLNKNDLWNALREYPDARKLLLVKGRELLRKDNLLDENAPEEQQTAEELAEQLNNHVKVLQTRMARLIVEHTSTETKLNKRIEMLEVQLRKYRSFARRQKSLQASSSVDRTLDDDDDV
ncbi:unnamed protein product [Auanema sp. JU1783]|nr:unnamed protein product [Auanema sp. JU1783]